MVAAVVEGCGAGRVELQAVPVPAPGPRDLLVRVRAAGVNPRDWMMVTGNYPFRFTLPRGPFVLGADLAGEVAAVGSAVTGFEPGERVCAMQTLRGQLGAFAPWCTVRASVSVRIPDTVSDEQAAGLPLAGLTARQALGAGRPGRRVLVIGASGGVGHFAAQIARAEGDRVTGVCSGRNFDFATSLGCERVIDYERDSYESGGPYDLVFDTIGRESPGRCRAVLAPGGTHVTTVPRREALRRAAADLLAGRLPGRLSTRLVLVRSSGRDLADLVRMAATGRLVTRVERVWPLEQVADALAASRAGRTRGKLILRMDPGNRT